MKSFLAALLIFSLLLQFIGCGGKSIKTIEAENNGYICSSCKAKFYTAGDVFAVSCPQCKSYEIKEVVSYVCPKEHVTLALRGGSVSCQQCGTSAAQVRLPKESDLKSWGAVKKSKAEVSRK